MNQTKSVSEEREQGKAPPARRSSGSGALLRVDLWTESLLADVPPTGVEDADVPSGALAMVGDLIAVGGGELRESSSASVSALFKDAVSAVHAARHLQRLVQGFSRASEAGPLHACFTLTSASETDRQSGPCFSRTYSMKQGQGGQVLLAGSICEEAGSIPGLQFKVLPAGTLDPDRSGLQRAVLQLLPPIHMDGYVDEPAEVKAPVDKGKGRTAVSGVPGRVSIAPASVVAAQKELPLPSVMAAGKPVSVAGREVVASSHAKEFSWIKVKPRWAIVGVAGVGVLAGVLIFVPIFRRASNPAPRPGENQARPSFPVEGANAPASIQPAKTGVVPVPPEPPPAKGVVVAAPRQEDAVVVHGRTTPRPAPSVAEPTPARAGGQRGLTFSGAEIDSLISRADKHAGDGDYDRAILEYRTVLNQEPANAVAKKGLARALFNKNHK